MSKYIASIEKTRNHKEGACMMKKGYSFLVCGVLSIGMLAPATADIQIQWSSNAYLQDENLALYTGQTYHQLLWSSSAPTWTVNSQVDSSDAAGTMYTYGLDTEYLLSSVIAEEYARHGAGATSPQNPTPITAVYANIGGESAMEDGYLYSRIFGGPTVEVDTYYYQSSVMGPADLSPTSNPLGPAQVHVTASQFPDYGTGGPQVDSQVEVVPEPASMALFAMGALVVGLRRRKKS